MRGFQKDSKLIMTILILIGLLAVGYATLGANMKINGVAQVPALGWDVHFKNGSITPTVGSVTIDTSNNEQAARIDNATQVSYAVRLSIPGDFYEFTVIVENTGNIDAMIDSVSSKLGNTEITSGTLPSYLDYSVSYSDGTPISAKHILVGNGGIETFKVRLEFKEDISANDLPGTSETLSLNFQVNYIQADNTAIEVPHPRSLDSDSWETIISNVQNGNPELYIVGTTKTVDMGTFGTHTLRVANNSTPTECETAGFSETACGFVLEFADIITTHVMNDTSTNVGGWPATGMRTYVNSDIYNALPSTIKNAVINTIVVSGHGNNDNSNNNFTSTDKMYLLSAMEVWGNSGNAVYDTARTVSRQLDYYANFGLGGTEYLAASKKLNGSDSAWWLRTATSYSTSPFYEVKANGGVFDDSPIHAFGVSPAFRIG